MTFDWLTRRVVSGLHLNKFYLESLVWPKLTEELIDTLAEESLTLLSANPRFMDLNMKNDLAVISDKVVTKDYIDSHATIERIVASGFELTRSMLEEVLSDRPADRRGLWRHFASDPHAGAVRAALIEGYRPESGVLSRLG
jgi:hypothetical protein